VSARAPSTLALAGLAVLLQSAPADAGVIVLTNGKVTVGKIRADEVNSEKVVVRWPYKARTFRGKQEFPRFRIRWFDIEADEPTEAYWEEFNDIEEFPIEEKYLPLRERWKIRQQVAEQEGEFNDILVVDPFSEGGTALSPIPIENERFRIQKPEGWTSSIEEGITVFEAADAGRGGYRARIHVFFVDSLRKPVQGRTIEAMTTSLLEEQLVRLADGGDGFEVRERKRLKPKANGGDQELVTRTVRLERPIVSLRQIYVRKMRTFFFATYCHEQDYAGLELLFKACMRSLEIFEDAAAAGPGDKGAGTTDAGTTDADPGQGQ